MKYIINERQYNLLTEQEEQILRVPFVAFGNDWDVLQRFMERRGNPPYEIMGDLDLGETNVESLGNLTSVGGHLDLSVTDVKSLGSLTSVGDYLDLRYTPLTKKYTKDEIRSMVEVGDEIYL
jgi:hypothetical protein